MSGAPLTLRSDANPITNDSVGVAFKQASGAADALRTGPDAKSPTCFRSTTAA